MQQNSSVPERKSQIDAIADITATNIEQGLAIQQLRASLWVEQSVNALQRRLNECLNPNLLTKEGTGSPFQAEIFQVVVNELGAALETTGVAIALPHSGTLADTYKICHVVDSPSQKLTASHLEVTFPKGKTKIWRLGQIVRSGDLQQLHHHQKSAWAITLGGGQIGWLIIASPPLATESTEFPAIHRIGLIERCLTAANVAISQSASLHSVLSKCQQLEQKNRELTRANELKSEFLANTSHEIRTPLSSILGFTHLLLAQGYKPDNLRHQEYLNIILASGKHLLALINDILDLSKIEANQLDLEMEPVNVPELCRSAIALVKEKANDKGLQLRLDVEPHATALVADALRLKQMLFNLLSNALKFTSQGTVCLQVKHRGVFLHFTVWDTGTGISKEQQALLFQPYSQITNAIVNREEGTGLGLALTQKLAELHGGWVELQSELNRGSQFTVVLPLTPAVGKGEKERAKEDQKALECESGKVGEFEIAASKIEIMVVEDNLHNGKLILAILGKLGYRVTWAKNAAGMWQALKETAPTLILMDINLPDVDGLTLIEQLHACEQFRNIPVIAQTAMAMKGDRETCLARGAVDYISKPIDLKLLASLVSKYSKSIDIHPAL